VDGEEARMTGPSAAESKTVPKWVKSWCCQDVALRFGIGEFSELRCKCCGNMLFADTYNYRQLYIVEGEPYDETETVPNLLYKEPVKRKPKKVKTT
jgi:hypothetical protein